MARFLVLIVHALAGLALSPKPEPLPLFMHTLLLMHAVILALEFLMSTLLFKLTEDGA